MTVRGRGGRRSKAQLEADARYRDYLDRCDDAWDEWHKRHPHAKAISYSISVMLVMFIFGIPGMIFGGGLEELLSWVVISLFGGMFIYPFALMLLSHLWK